MSGSGRAAIRQLLNRARTSIRERLGALVPVDLLARLIMTASSGPSGALTLAGSGALAAKLSGAMLLSVTPVVAVAPGPVPSAPVRHAEKIAARSPSAGRRVSVRVPPSAVGRSVAPTAVRPEVDHERERYEHPLEAGHVVAGAPRPEGGVGQSRPGQQEEPDQRQDPAAERATQHVAEDPQDEQHQPGGDQSQQSEETAHARSVAGPLCPVVTQTG